MPQFKKIPEEERVGVLRPVGKGAEKIGLIILSKDRTFSAFVGARSVQDVLGGRKPYAVLQKPKKQDPEADNAALANMVEIDE